MLNKLIIFNEDVENIISEADYIFKHISPKYNKPQDVNHYLQLELPELIMDYEYKDHTVHFTKKEKIYIREKITKINPKLWDLLNSKISIDSFINLIIKSINNFGNNFDSINNKKKQSIGNQS